MEPYPRFMELGAHGLAPPGCNELGGLASPSKRILLPCPQLAPRASCALQMATREPPLASDRQSLPLAKNPSDRPSGDQKGKYAPLVVGTIRLIGSNANNVFSQAASSVQ